jgi:hypothetical protein
MFLRIFMAILLLIICFKVCSIEHKLSPKPTTSYVNPYGKDTTIIKVP